MCVCVCDGPTPSSQALLLNEKGISQRVSNSANFFCFFFNSVFFQFDNSKYHRDGESGRVGGRRGGKVTRFMYFEIEFIVKKQTSMGKNSEKNLR